MQTGPLSRFEIPESFHPRLEHPVYIPPPIVRSNGLTMINLPFISDRWSELTHGNPATVTKLVVTSDWKGTDALSFDIYPPPRPSPTAKLHWEKEAGLILGQGIRLLYSLQPADNPNHLVVRIPSVSLPQLEVNAEFGQIKPDPNRRIVNAYILWWENR